MMAQKMTYWKETDETYLGFLNNFPDHWTQGENLEKLKVHLRDLYHEFSIGDLPGIRQEIELDLAETTKLDQPVGASRLCSPKSWGEARHLLQPL